MEDQQYTEVNPVGLTEPQPHQNKYVDPAEMIQKLLENTHVPPDLQEEFWALFGQTTKITFLDKESLKRNLIMWQILRLTIIESLPKKAYDEKLEKALNMIGMEFENNLRRSLGSGKLNTIELITATTNASYTEKQLGASQNTNGIATRMWNALRGV